MITSAANRKIKLVKKLQSGRRIRMKETLFVVEGTRWIQDLTKMGAPVEFWLCTAAWLDKADHASIISQIPAGLSIISNELMGQLSDTESPPGVMAVVPIPQVSLPQRPSLLLALDAVSTPGNLGTILRTSAAAGVDGVLLGPGCVDAYNPKVVRGGMGAHLRLPIKLANWDEIGEIGKNMHIWIASANGHLEYTAVPWCEPSMLIIGSEAHGPGNKARELADGLITIPMKTKTESLNAAVAASVILFEAARQRRETQ